jgi:hypothetical protein
MGFTMARGKCSFRQRDVSAAVRAVVAAGLEPTRAEIDPVTGKIVVAIGRPNEARVNSENEWDEVLGGKAQPQIHQ